MRNIELIQRLRCHGSALANEAADAIEVLEQHGTFDDWVRDSQIDLLKLTDDAIERGMFAAFMAGRNGWYATDRTAAAQPAKGEAK